MATLTTEGQSYECCIVAGDLIIQQAHSKITKSFRQDAISVGWYINITNPMLIDVC